MHKFTGLWFTFTKWYKGTRPQVDVPAPKQLAAFLLVEMERTGRNTYVSGECGLIYQLGYLSILQYRMGQAQLGTGEFPFLRAADGGTCLVITIKWKACWNRTEFWDPFIFNLWPIIRGINSKGALFKPKEGGKCSHTEKQRTERDGFPCPSLWVSSSCGETGRSVCHTEHGPFPPSITPRIQF